MDPWYQDDFTGPAGLVTGRTPDGVGAAWRTPVHALNYSTVIHTDGNGFAYNGLDTGYPGDGGFSQYPGTGSICSGTPSPDLDQAVEIRLHTGATASWGSGNYSELDVTFNFDDTLGGSSGQFAKIGLQFYGTETDVVAQGGYFFFSTAIAPAYVDANADILVRIEYSQTTPSLRVLINGTEVLFTDNPGDFYAPRAPASPNYLLLDLYNKNQSATGPTDIYLDSVTAYPLNATPPAPTPFWTDFTGSVAENL